MASRTEVVHVVAAVLQRENGDVLLGQRGGAGPLAGAWEFPGGKVEPGETTAQALLRELHEELGIVLRPDALTPLIAVPQIYPDKQILLDVYRVARWQGVPHGAEGQGLRWASLDTLPGLHMPPADRPVVAALADPPLYLITPQPGPDSGQFLRCVDAALAAGIVRVQLRAGALNGNVLYALAAEVATRCRVAGAQLFVNAGLDGQGAAVASALGVGVHLRASQLGSALPDPTLPIAGSCHDADQLRQAQALGAAFAVLGPVRQTATHAETAPMGWQAFAALRAQVSLPIYALGGLSPHDLTQARRHGAQGVAGIRELWPETTLG